MDCPKVCVLMSTFNGEKYIEEQVDSILCQASVKPYLIIRDDGSEDKTLEIIKKIEKSYPNIEIADEISGFHNPKGIGSNFFLLLRYAFNNYNSVNYFSFADQDDVWKQDKLIRAITKLSVIRKDSKGLYFSKKRLVNADLSDLRSDYITFNNDFTDFLSKNQASGCTMVLNREFARMMLSAKVEDYPYLHDVTILKTALCTKAEIFFDRDYESMFYRLHGNNVTYDDIDIRLMKKSNLTKIFHKRRHYMKSIAKDILRDFGDYLSEERAGQLMLVADYKKPINSLLLLLLYWKNKNRGIKDKIRFTGMVILRGV